MSFNFSQFKTRFPELATTDESYFNAVKADAILDVNANVWGVKTDTGVMLLTAHLITMGSRSGVSGSVIFQKVGDLQRRFSDNVSSESELALTSYGSEFLRTRKTLVTSPLII